MRRCYLFSDTGCERWTAEPLRTRWLCNRVINVALQGCAAPYCSALCDEHSGIGLPYHDALGETSQGHATKEVVYTYDASGYMGSLGMEESVTQEGRYTVASDDRCAAGRHELKPRATRSYQGSSRQQY